MAKFLEYILSLKDQVSGALNRITGSSSNTRSNINGLRGDVDRLDDSFRRASGGGLSAFKVALGGLIEGGIRAAWGSVSGIANDMFDGLVKREQDIVGLTTFVGDNARNVYDAIKRDAEVTPFSTQSLIDVNRALISSGLSADQARKDAMNLANAISAVGKGNAELSNMAVNMQQIKTTGKASAMDIKQFAFAGINIYEMLHKATGKSIDDIKEMDVSYELLSKALEKAAGKGGMYEGALEKQGKTMGALWDTAKEVIGNSIVDLGESMRPLFEKMLGYLQRFGNKLPSILSAVKPYIEMVGNAFFWLLDALIATGRIVKGLWDDLKSGDPVLLALTVLLSGIAGGLFAVQLWTKAVAVATAIWEGVQWALNVALSANPVGIVIGLIIGLIAVIGFLIYKYSGWGEAWQALVTYLQASWGEFKADFYLTWLQIEDFFLSGVDKLKAAWYNFQKLWDEDAANAGLSKLADDTKKRADEIAKARGVVADFQRQEKEALSKITLKDTGKGFKDVLNDTKNALGISSPKIPGGSVNTKMGGGSGDKKKGGKSNEAVATGGQKNTTIHINIGKQIESLTVMASNIKEGAEKIRDIIVDEMTRAIAMSQSIAD